MAYITCISIYAIKLNSLTKIFISNCERSIS